MKSSDPPPLDNNSDEQSAPAPEGYRVVRLPSWKMKFRVPAVPVPEDEEKPNGRPREYFEHPFLRRPTTSASSPWFYLGVIPIKHFGDPDWLGGPIHQKDLDRRVRDS